MNVRIGAMEKVLRQPRASVFALAATLGFDGIEIEVRADPAAIRAESEESGIAVCSVICSGEGLGGEVEEDRLIARSRLLQAIRDAQDLGAGGVLLPQFELTSLEDAGAVRRFIEDIGLCTPEAETRNVVITWENALDAEATRAVLEHVGSDRFRCYFDLANVLKRGRDPQAELRALGNLVYQVHAKNLNRQPLDAPGVNLRECLQVLRERDYSGWIVLETAPGDDPVASARHNLEVLRAALVAV